MSAQDPALPPILEARGLAKAFGALRAVDGVDLAIRPGEIVALLGENGAGKTTLMNLLFGLLRADAGEMRLDGAPVTFSGPRDALSRGIAMVHQHFQLVGPMSASENLVLGREPTRGPLGGLPCGLLDRRAAEARLAALAERYRLPVPPRTPVEQLPVGLRQRLEILKALDREVRLLILDEPTSVLTPDEVDELLTVLRALRDQGVGVVLITHKLPEALAVADRHIVLRRGRVVARVDATAADEAGLAAAIVGRALDAGEAAALGLVAARGGGRGGMAPGAESPAAAVDREHGVGSPRSKDDATAPPVLSASRLRLRDPRGATVLDGLDLALRPGEILGLAGVQGNGQSALVEVLAGLRRPEAGRVTLAGHDVTRASPRERQDRGLAHIPEDRQRYGLVGPLPVADNLVLDRFREPAFGRGPWLDRAAVDAAAREAIERYAIRPPLPERPAGQLSGGNQQKLVVAREVGRDLVALLAAQPTRGLDVGAAAFVHTRLREARDRGVGVLLVSSELDEVLALSDRVAVIYRGRITHGVAAREAERATVGRWMAGGSV